MHHLDRTQAAPPPVLQNYGLRNTWGDVTGTDRAALRAALGQLQGDRCAYCERPLGEESRDPHIEHFEQRSRAPALTFQWSNLFWSCSQPAHCGKHKDSPAIINSYARADLVKPDVDDPRRLLAFTSNGAVHPRPGLNAHDHQRATETIRVFALDARSLRTARVAYLVEPLLLAAEATEIADVNEAQALLAGFADDYRGKPYEAAIFDILGVP
jgi:uncharacterized protein (TIGR02646 family)